MRYYGFVLDSSAEKIQENATIKIRDYDFSNQNPIAAMNNYMQENMKNNQFFFAYREEENSIYSAFAFNEKKYSVDTSYDDICMLLKRIFGINAVKIAPYEVTMHEFYDYLLEGRRRSLTSAWNSRYTINTNLSVFEGNINSLKSLHYSFEEKIATDSSEKNVLGIYDKSFKRELLNIKEHKTLSDYHANIVHYIISARSIEASIDMAERLVTSLVLANRVSGRRIVIIRDMEPDLYKYNSYLEELIENNYGGIIIFDLSEKFGYEPVEYKMTSRYLEMLVKKYKNDCLFIFTYNMDSPGFSYQVLTEIKKYVIPVVLREGTGDRKTAVKYIRSMIKKSDYSEYVSSAGEFMKQYPGAEFTQTDVIRAFDRYESWCLNKYILKAYDFDIDEEFYLDRDENAASSYETLKNMIGLKTVKRKIDDILAADVVEKERKKRLGSAYKSGTMHMVFGGNPGSAKTTVAKLFAGITKEKGILKSGAFVECCGMDLDGLGCTYAIRKAFDAASGGVLFIDEAYSLQTDTAVTVLIQEMENRRDEVIVILAGYSERMKSFIELNEGLKSRIPYWIDFPDYDTDELTEIFKLMVAERNFTITDDALKESRYIFEKVRLEDNFGNGRYVRNLLEQTIQKQSIRLFSKNKPTSLIRKKELFLITKLDIVTTLKSNRWKEDKIPARDELAGMVGLKRAKEIINKAVAGYKFKKVCMDKGLNKSNASLHMIFTGNPGSAKTTVARLFARMLYDEKVLATGNFVEVGRAELVGDHVGATAPLVKKRFRQAQGGVLFIDEAYSLCDGVNNGFGDEAINTIVQEMENHREDVIVIFAGYPDRMKHFLDRNPGLFSRIAFQVEFDDYTAEELCDIARLMVVRKEMQITDNAIDKIERICEIARKDSDFGNGRFVRRLIEEAEMNLAKRLMDAGTDNLAMQMLTRIEESDIPDWDNKKGKEKIKIGFG